MSKYKLFLSYIRELIYPTQVVIISLAPTQTQMESSKSKLSSSLMQDFIYLLNRKKMKASAHGNLDS